MLASHLKWITVGGSRSFVFQPMSPTLLRLFGVVKVRALARLSLQAEEAANRLFGRFSGGSPSSGLLPSYSYHTAVLRNPSLCSSLPRSSSVPLSISRSLSLRLEWATHETIAGGDAPTLDRLRASGPRYIVRPFVPLRHDRGRHRRHMVRATADVGVLLRHWCVY